MAGKLTNKLMDQLEQWIGTGPKKFDLIFNITVDGCNAATFHQKCDNQGPTVTVLYNQQGSVYGGYTTVNWDQSSSYKNDVNAFLFRLQSSGSVAANKFPRNSNGSDVYCGTGYGPTFGSGHDLLTFRNSIINSGGYYTLNGHVNLNSSYNSQGITNDQVTNGTTNVTELEVYKVTDGKRIVSLENPWRTTPEWNSEYFENLMSEVTNFDPPEEVQVSQSKILIIGPVGAGKSSFFNTIASVFRGHVTGQAPSGCAEHSITSKFRMYQVRTSSRKTLNFRLCDTRGLEETQGIDAHDIVYLLEGNVPAGYQFNPSVPISQEIAGFKKNPTLKDRIHCVCIVIDGSTAGVLPEKLLEKIKAIQTKMNVRCVPQRVLLTKVDKICPMVEADTAQVFKSEAIFEQVNKISQILGIPRSHVLPMKNYEKEVDLNESTNILALLTLRQILRATEDYMFDFLDEQEPESDNVTGLTAKD